MQVLAFESGVALRLRDIMADAGNRNLSIRAAMVQGLPNRGGRLTTAESLTLADFDAIASAGLPIVRMAPVRSASRRVEFLAMNLSADIHGTRADYLSVLGHVLAQGRYIDSVDEQSSARVAVLGARVAQELFGERQGTVLDPADITEQTILISGIPFRVIGVLNPKGSGPTGIPQDDGIYIPLQTLQRRVVESQHLSAILLELPDLEVLSIVREGVNALLLDSQRIRPGRNADFELLQSTLALDFMRGNSGLVSVFFRNFSWLLLSLSGAGIFALNLMNAKERDSEFGLRKAVGARNSDILALILTESLLLGLLGGSLGLLSGTLVTRLARRLFDWTMQVDYLVLSQALGTALVLSLLASTVPAWQAAHRHPLHSLNRT